MRLLLDTCILYDWIMDALTDPETVALIQQTGAFVSAVVVWEMSIKHALGKITLPSRRIVEDVGAQGFGWLNTRRAMPRSYSTFSRITKTLSIVC